MECKINYISDKESLEKREDFTQLLRNSPIPNKELSSNLGLYLNRPLLSKILFLDNLYQKIVNTHGVIMEFGVRWGQNISLFQSLRGIYEPYNFNRKIIGFDTFEGFPAVHDKDGNHEIVEAGSFNVTKNYKEHLDQILDYQKHENPLPKLQKCELVVGDANKTIHEYLAKHPETLIAFAYFDFDIYEPTKNCLEAIKPHLCKGAIIAFDELNLDTFPGETLAFQEVLGANNFKIHRSPLTPYQSYVIFE